MLTAVRVSAQEVEMEVLITVKAYPNPSTKYMETVCVAGIRLDVEPYRWVRLYPVPFRTLPESLKFKKYDIVRVRAVKAHQDARPESYKPILESIEVIDHVSCGPYWAERLPIVEEVEIASMCELKRLQAYDGTSLGFFKPAEIVDFIASPTSDSWNDAQLGALGQGNLFREVRSTLEKIPYDFHYVYRCNEAECSTHKMSMIDWELAQLYRRTSSLSEDLRLSMIRKKWLDEICSPKRATYFYAGNLAGHHGSFVLLGVVWPRKSKAPRKTAPAASLF
jgi:hypothetical protein